LIDRSLHVVQTVEVRTVTLKVVMHCEGCAGSVKRAVKRIRGTQIHDIHMYHLLSENIVERSQPSEWTLLKIVLLNLRKIARKPQ
jgi:hypothetical protein